jgi:precorrin-2 dehydrogenase/sirohydrochlorin ferrochelatase
VRNEVSVYYPMMVDLSGRRCAVVGGGAVAERKIASLLDAGASAVVISPAFTTHIEQWISENRLEGIAREYVSSDADNAFLLIAATDDEQVNRRVHADAAARGLWVNVVDKPEWSSFIVPAVVRRGKLTIAVSTSGASPSAAAAIRNEIASQYGEEYEIYLDFLSEFRLKVKEIVKDTKHRQGIFRQLSQLDILGMIRNGQFDEFHRRMMKRLADGLVIFVE